MQHRNFSVISCKSCLLSLSLAIGYASYAQPSIHANDSEIIWSADNKLKISDFRAKKDDMQPSSIQERRYLDFAGTLSSITMVVQYECTEHELEYQAVNVFFPYLSWHQPASREEDSVTLLHEQGHFDLNEIVVRNFRNFMSVIQPPYSGKLIRGYVDSFRLLARNFQDRYDKETNYSRNSEKQLYWLNFIKDSLAKLQK